jgi:hypothetical protein
VSAARRRLGIVALGAGVLAVVIFVSVGSQVAPDPGRCPPGQVQAVMGVDTGGTSGYATKQEAVADALGTLDASPYGGAFGEATENADGSFSIEETNDLISGVEVHITESNGRYLPGSVTFCAKPISTRSAT